MAVAPPECVSIVVVNYVLPQEAKYFIDIEVTV